MAELTQKQIIAYNKKVVAAKEKVAQDKVKREFSAKEFAQLCAELSEHLGREITLENFNEAYNSFVREAEQTITSGMKILEELERESVAAQATSVPVDAVSSGSPPSAPETPIVANEVSNGVAKAGGGLDLDSLLGI